MTGITLVAFKVFIVSTILFVMFSLGYYVGYREAVKDIKIHILNKRKNSQKTN